MGSLKLRAAMLIAGALLTWAGCDERHTQVRSYDVPKEQPPAAQPAPMPAASGTMEWTLPDGWTSIENTSPIRFATLVAGSGDEQIEVAVTRLKGSAGGVPANINMWRAQVGLPPTSDDELAAAIIPIQARDAQGVMLDVTGAAAHGTDASAPRILATIFPTQMHSWFIKAFAPSAAIETHRDAFIELCESVRFSTDAASAAPPVAPPPASPARGAPAWGPLPDDWSVDAAPRPMSVASMTVAGDASLTITPLPGSQDALANVNRWRRQLGLGPLETIEQASPVSVEMAGHPAVIVDLAGGGRRTIAATSVRDGVTWFYKLTGPDEVVARQRDAFESFVRSIRFDGGPRE